MKNIIDSTWEVKVYGTPYALCKIDIMRPLNKGESIRWTYNVMIQIYPDGKGVDNQGTRASGGAEACVISNTPKVDRKYRLVEIGETIVTPFGNYRVEWANKFNSLDRDNLALVEIK
jgi:hypothetical protein